MKSPFTGKEMKRIYEKRTWNFRGEEYEYHHLSWLCEDTGESFTTDESDTAAFVQVTNQYRAKYGIPYTDEIVAVRSRYGISATNPGHRHQPIPSIRAGRGSQCIEWKNNTFHHESQGHAQHGREFKEPLLHSSGI